MPDNHSATMRIIFVVAALLCFLGAAALSFPPDNTWRIRLLGIGLACWVASTLW